MLFLWSMQNQGMPTQSERRLAVPDPVHQCSRTALFPSTFQIAQSWVVKAVGKTSRSGVRGSAARLPYQGRLAARPNGCAIADTLM